MDGAGESPDREVDIMFLVASNLTDEALQKHYDFLEDSPEGTCVFVWVVDEVELRGGWAPEVVGLCLRHGDSVEQDKDT